MESNKDEAKKCILIAEQFIKEKNRDKAEKFLKKAERLYPTETAKVLLQQIQDLSPGQVETKQPKRQNNPLKMEESVKEPEFTPEQEAAVKRIKTCKDYYEILCISKDATDLEIKKAYKKLALVLHPDKNKCPGAAEAFKSVGNAVTLLTDPVKRKQYDLYGHDERSTTSRAHQRYASFESDTTPEEIFNMFFGGGFADSNVYVRRGGRWQRQTTASQNDNHHSHQRETHPFNGFIQMLPILLAIVLSMASSFFISDPAYSLQISQKYPVPRRTQNLHVPYFVKNNFHSEYQGSVKRLELLVEEEYLTNLRHSCYREKNYRDSMIWKAKNFGDRDLFHTAQNIKTPSCDQLNQLRNHVADIMTLGITNQRETTIVWDKTTGKPLHNAIVWNDIRTDSTVDIILARTPDNNKDYYKPICGLPISPYFSAFKLKWLMHHSPQVKKAIKAKTCLFGTVDSWIIWNLTGGPQGGVHITDVTNASRTFLMNLDTLNWDPFLLSTFKIPLEILPEIRSSSEIYGQVGNKFPLAGKPISAILGNQQSALVGQNCLKKGEAKNTYRSGCFLLYNTGDVRVQSAHGLVTTVAYKFGKSAPVYALEGSIAVAGAAINWLRDNMGFIKNVSNDTESFAQEVFNTGDVYFVPAFKGLFAPYWRKDARGIICGLTAFSTKQHILRAALEAICFQTRDILDAMNKDYGFPLTKLHVDGVMTKNSLLMQLQADICGIPVIRAQSQDITALGTAIAAGCADGIGLWDLHAEEREMIPSDIFLPTSTESERDSRYAKWKMAVQRSLGWSIPTKSAVMTEERYKMLASIPAALYLMSSFGLIVLSTYINSNGVLSK